jgi:preprotein translocase subunit SecG
MSENRLFQRERTLFVDLKTTKNKYFQNILRRSTGLLVLIFMENRLGMGY